MPYMPMEIALSGPFAGKVVGRMVDAGRRTVPVVACKRPEPPIATTSFVVVTPWKHGTRNDGCVRR